MTPSRAAAERPPRTTAEWWTFTVAVTLIGSVVGLILLSWATGPSGPPIVQARQTGPPVREAGVFRVPFEVRNDGGETATDVQVSAELTIGGRVEGEGEQSVMFLSGGEVEQGEFLFDSDPNLGRLSIGVASYAHP
jgi:uncharacterized protein (TIGR02588 family)